MLRVLSKLSEEVASSESKLAEIKAEFEEHKSTDEYKKWFKEHTENEDTDAVRNDPDPEGWEAFITACESPADLAFDLAAKVGMA